MRPEEESASTRLYESSSMTEVERRLSEAEHEIAAAREVLHLLDAQQPKAITLKRHSSSEVELILKGLQVAGSAERLAEWMRTPIHSLNGQTPYNLMQSDEGRKQVQAVLTKIDHGIY